MESFALARYMTHQILYKIIPRKGKTVSFTGHVITTPIHRDLFQKIESFPNLQFQGNIAFNVIGPAANCKRIKEMLKNNGTDFFMVNIECLYYTIKINYGFNSCDFLF